MRQPRLRTVLIATGAAIALLAGGTTAYAAAAGPVDGSGVIHGCYDTGGNLKVIDASTPCPKGYTALNWAQTGAQGAQGPLGPQGPQGPTGPPGPKGDKGDPGTPGTGATVASLASGDPNCASGGVSVTDGSGNTAYACDGATGLAGPKGDTGPQGPPGPKGDQGPAGPSTAGINGLDVYVTSASSDGNLVRAYCPADHPYVLGGGGSAWNGSTSGDLEWSGPVTVDNASEGDFPSFNFGWIVIASGGPVSAYAICAK